MVRKILVTVLAALLIGCTGYTYPVSKATEQGEPPRILDYYAAEVIRPGTTWRVYLAAEDVDGDMRSIAAELWQTGVGFYQLDVTRIKKGDRQNFAGYLFLNTPPEVTLMWDELRLKVFVRDRQGNTSERVYLPLRFDSVSAEEPPEKWQMAANHRLGAIAIDIWSSHQYNAGNENGATFP